ncbi:FGGY-family carbohydrate kinase [Tropicimonas sp. IMCC6043]|uniref:FGGY-family carbohydrate kinase n=1 Tax=Tropicimonas sp. IMCC6043 TaxID=2510645 RepID=UPI00101DE1A1|nr:FGGY-family carbohydrate kinase [Tropicimonas sp. IMCC6043]RYH07724.1 carbohydrate kinase [Tropicimonas sp. IMCC6043]
MTCLLGIDSGLTVTKAVLFDADGTALAVARREVPQLMPEARHVERDMDTLWRESAAAIREVIERSGRSAGEIAAVATTAHGDGIYLLDRARRPLGAGILSLDSRAGDVIRDWVGDGTSDRALDLTGQSPHVAAQSALLAWIRRHQPERFAAIGTAFSCKDFLRFCLTGTIGTDRTEASSAFTDYRSQDYSDDALRLYGLEALAHALPPASHCAEIVGHVTAEAAVATGLVQGTPVAAGIHDVTASALGIGGHKQGTVGIIAGTYSINEVVSDAPRIDARWFCRNAVAPGLWNSQAISPSSTTNYEWFLTTFCAAERARAEAEGSSIHAVLAPEIEAAMARPSTLLYQPFLFGSPYGEIASASFLGLHGWHTRGDVLAALLEGIVFNHRHHVDALREGFPVTTGHLTGGASRNPTVAQLFADVIGLPILVTETDEAAAWGAALCAGAAVGLYPAFDADPRDLAAITRTYLPDPARQAHYDARYVVYREIADGFAETWEKLDALGRGTDGAGRTAR